MPAAQFTLFVSVTFIMSASPGPVMLSCMTNGGRYGMKKAFEGMLGASLGNLVLVALSALGLGLIVSQNDVLFNIVKWLGAGYLVFLGLQIIRQPIARNDLHEAAVTTNDKSVLFSSFGIAISNPKGLIYFGALFPQFINYQESLGIQFLILTLVFLTTDFIWMSVYALAGNKIMSWLKTPKHQLLFNYISGAVLMAAGCAMAFSGKL